MSSQASVRSIDALKELRVAMALYGEDTLGAIGAVEAEVRRTVRWLMEEQPVYWQEQIKRRREQVSTARAEVFKKNLQKRADYSPPMSEQKENLRKAEASLMDAEKRYAAVKKWQPLFKHAVLEYHASVQRIKDLTAGDMPRAVNLLSRMIDSLEAYLRVTAPSGLEALPGSGAGAGTSMAIPTAQVDTVAVQALDEAEAAAALEAQTRGQERPDAPADVPHDETDGGALEPISHSNDEGVDA
jgi:hypothetical protein